MNAAGIDVSKGKSMAAIFCPFNEVEAKPFEVHHTGSELRQSADCLKSLDGETRVAMEHTGRYCEQIAQYLHDEGIYVSAANPKLIKDYGTGNTLRHVKTDRADAKQIAKFGLDRWASEMGGFCRVLLARRLCSGYEPIGFRAAVCQVV